MQAGTIEMNTDTTAASRPWRAASLMVEACLGLWKQRTQVLQQARRLGNPFHRIDKRPAARQMREVQWLADVTGSGKAIPTRCPDEAASWGRQPAVREES